MSIKEAIQKIMEEKIGGSASMLCTVTAVDGSTCSVTTLDTEIDLYGVRLQAATSNGILLKPKAGSIVVITPITDFEFVVVMFSDIDEITLMDGSFGGLTKTQELKTQIDKTNDVVNTILTVLTGSPINEPGSGAPSALQAALHTALGIKTVGDFSGIENSLIKHGKI
jgi:hypothetical protein